MISVIVTTYNNSEYISNCIESVIHQSFSDFEIIVVDDASTDNTKEILPIYCDHPKVKCYYLEKNRGVSYSRNLGASKAKGEWLCFVDGDDYINYTKLKSEWKYINSSNKDGVASNFQYVNSERYPWLNTSQTYDITIEQVAKRTLPYNSLYRNELIQKNHFEDLGGYDINLDLLEDWDFKIRYMSKYDLGLLNSVQNNYRIHSGGLSRKDDLSYLSALWYLYKKHASNDYGIYIKTTIYNLMSKYLGQLKSNSGKEYYKWKLKHWYLRVSKSF